MWTKFQDVAPVADESYPEGVIASLTKVGDAIGGLVKRNFDMGIEDIQRSPDWYPASPAGFTNACATRLSYVLNHSGSPIPTCHLWSTVTGADHKNYIFRVQDMRTYLPHAFGAPDIDKGEGTAPGDFAGKRAIMVFDVDFADASGHAMLWDGERAIDEDYFHP